MTKASYEDWLVLDKAKRADRVARWETLRKGKSLKTGLAAGWWNRMLPKFLIPALAVLLTGCEPRLHRAVKSRDYDQVAQYLNAGDNIDINSSSEISDFFYGGLRLRYTPLHRAVLCEDIKMVNLLIGRGANLEARDPHRTPLFLAAHYGCVEIVKLLIEHGADPNASDLHTGETPLGRAKLGSYNELIKILIENGGKTRLELKAK